jgi:hypothetical protein
MSGRRSGLWVLRMQGSQKCLWVLGRQSAQRPNGGCCQLAMPHQNGKRLAAGGIDVWGDSGKVSE